MIPKKKIDNILAGYGNDLTIATICSHTALQIFHGARQEGFKTLGIVQGSRKSVYDSFPLARPDEYIIVKDFKDILKKQNQKKLIEKHAIIIPHGSFVEYVGAKNLENKFLVPMLGNRLVLDWEGNRERQREWLEKAGCRLPRIIRSPNQIKKPSLVKLYGAKGGKGFFIILSANELKRKLGRQKKYMIQEFIIGTRYYFHFFYSPLENRLELLSIDRRVESNIDELHRFGFTNPELEQAKIHKTFVVTGNQPLTIRESLLPAIFKMGNNVVRASQKIFFPGLIGPFCLETVCTDNLKFYVFEVSARIVAGTNLYPLSSPYTPYLFNEPMSTGRRIAREIKHALESNELSKIIY